MSVTRWCGLLMASLLLLSSNAHAQTPVAQSASVGCPDNYGVTIRGLNFAADSVVDARPYGSTGNVVETWRQGQLTRSTEGGQNVLRFTITTPTTQQLLNSQGLSLWVVNPSAGTWSSNVNIVRTVPMTPALQTGTASGPYGYDIVLQGTGFEAGAFIDVRSAGTGAVLQSYSGPQVTRSCVQGQTSLKITITDPVQRNYLNTTGLYFWVVNPIAANWSTSARVVRSGFPQPPANLTTLKGGSNINWYRTDFYQAINSAGQLVTECTREPYGIVKNYNASGNYVRDTVKQQLAGMYATGQRGLRVGVFFSDAETGTNLPLAPGGTLPSTYQANLANFLADIKAAGFAHVQLGLFPMGYSYDPIDWPSNWEGMSAYELRLNTYFNLIGTVRSIAAASGLAYNIDLGNEALSSDNAKKQRFISRLWTRYASTYGTADTVGFSFYLARVGGGEYTSALGRLATFYGSTWPAALQVHLYDYTSAREGELLTKLDQQLDQIGQPTRPIQIGEIFYDDAPAAQGVASAIPGTNRTVRTLFHWPKSRTGSQTPSCDGQNVSTPLTNWSAYSSRGF